MAYTVDQDTCIGCGSCEAVCPDVFVMDDNDKARVKKDAKQDCACAKDAFEICPVNAIKLVD